MAASSKKKGRAAGAPAPAAAVPAPRADGIAWRSHAPFILAVWLLCLLAYSNSFRAGLVFDNDTVIRQDARIQAATSGNLGLILSEEYWYRHSNSGLYRPLTTFSYLVNYAILGNGPNPAGYHWVNFFLHVLNAALVYMLGLLVFGERVPALALAALWAVHPLLTESVTNIVGRADLLAACGILSALGCHVRSAALAGRRRLAWLAALAAAAAVAVFSKESGVVVVAVLLLYDLAFAGESPWRARLAGYAALAPGFAAYFYLRGQVLASRPPALIEFVANPLMNAGFWTARLTAIKVVGKYLWLFVWPWRLSADYSYNQVPLFSGRWNNPEDAKTAAALAVCVASAALATLAYRRSKPLFFFIGFFFATLAPAANLVILTGTIMAERLMYLPAVGAAGCVVWVVLAAGRRLPDRRWVWALPALIAAAFAVRTYARNLDWTDEVALWSSVSTSSPASFMGHTNLVSTLAKRGGDLDRAAREAGRALAILDSLPDEINNPQPYAAAGMCYRLQGENTASAPERAGWYQRALEALNRGKRIDAVKTEEARAVAQSSGKTWEVHGFAQMYMELSRVYRDQGDRDLAAVALLEGLVVDPGATVLVSDLAEFYQEAFPRTCAVENAGASSSINLECPLVRGHLCSASRNVVTTYRESRLKVQAARIARDAVGGLGCPANLF